MGFFVIGVKQEVTHILFVSFLSYLTTVCGSSAFCNLQFWFVNETGQTLASEVVGQATIGSQLLLLGNF